MVGEEVVKHSSNIKALQEGEGEIGSLKPKGNFEASPHLRRQLITLATVHGKSNDYYRAALMPIIKGVVERLETVDAEER